MTAHFAAQENRKKRIAARKSLILRLLLCAMAIWFTVFPVRASYAQGFVPGTDNVRISNEEANLFYDRCIETPDPVMTEESQTEMCACMSVELQNSMSAEEYRLIKENGVAPGSEIYKKHLTYVYGPCITGAVGDYITLSCLADRRYRGYTTDIHGMCNCLSREMERFTSLYAPDLLAELLHRNPYFEDAMTPLLESPAFMKEKQEAANSCILKFGWDE